MRTMSRARVLWTGAVVIVLVAACGAGVSNRAGPLQHHFDARYLAPVPVEEQQRVLDAKDAHARTEMEHAKAAAEVGLSAAEVKVAKHEVEREKLAVKSCKERKSAAEKCYELKRIAESANQLEAAEQNLAAARARLAAVVAHHTYLVARLDHLRQVQYVAEATLELERARLAEDKGIRPPVASVAEFESQREQRAAYAAELLQFAEDRRRQAEDLRQQWENMIPKAEKPLPDAAGSGSAETPTQNEATPPKNHDESEEP